MMLRTFAAVASTLAVAGPAYAHEAWIQPNGQGGFLVGWGHPGETSGRYDTSLVTQAGLIDDQGRAVAFERIEQDGQVVLRPAQSDARPALAQFVYEPGATIQTSEGRYTRGSKTDHPGYRRAFYSVRSGAALTGWNDAFAQPAGFELELVPLSNPYAADAVWTVRLMHGGEPLSGARIELSGESGETNVQVSDAQGEAVFGTLPGGDYALTASHDIPLQGDRDVDARRLETNLRVYR